MDLHREQLDLPFNVRAYEGSYVGLAPVTIIHNVTIWLHGELNHTTYLTVRRNGTLSLHENGHKSGELPNTMTFATVRLQEDGDIIVATDVVTENCFNFTIETVNIEGGGLFYGSW